MRRLNIRDTRNTLVLLAVLATMAMTVGCSKKSTQPNNDQGFVNSVNWQSSSIIYSEAEGKKDISLLFVLVSWCPHCQHLKSETLVDSSVVDLLNSKFNRVQIDGDSDSLVVYKDSTVTCVQMRSAIYGVAQYPTIIVFDRAGNETDRIVGFKTPAQFVAILNQL